MENADVPQGTILFVRLSLSGIPLEDSQGLTANAGYAGTCVSFLFRLKVRLSMRATVKASCL